MTIIALDAMGGDNAPDEIVKGALMASAASDDLRILLFGSAERLKELVGDAERIDIVDAPGVITNHDSPALAIRKMTDSSMVMALEAVKRGEAHAFVTAGSTGAALTGGIFKIGRIKGVERPALAPVMPTSAGKPVLLIDCGANVDCKPRYLLDFALMGSVFMEKVYGVKRPSVALVNIGAEAEKGNELVKEAYALLESSNLNFSGNIEGRDLYTGAADVLVTDGFAGNLVLKTTEGVAELMMSIMKREFTANKRSQIGALMLRPALRRVRKFLDYSEYGGAPLLGVSKVMVKAHGSSNARAISGAVTLAKRIHESGVVESIAAGLESSGANKGT